MMGAGTTRCQDMAPYVTVGTPHLSPLSQSYEDDCRLSEGRFKTDFERETELSVVSPEFRNSQARTMQSVPTRAHSAPIPSVRMNQVWCPRSSTV